MKQTHLIIAALMLVVGCSKEQVKSRINETYEDGKWIEWYSNGQKKEEQTFKNKEEGGTVSLWYDNGQKWKEGTYKTGGQREGTWTWWHMNGQKSYERIYENGVLIEVTLWDEDGNEIAQPKTDN